MNRSRRPDADARREAEARRREVAMARARAKRDVSRERQKANVERQKANVERWRSASQVSLVDLVDRLLDGGVVIHGDITLAVADVDLLYVGLRALVSSVETMERELGIRPTAKSHALESTSV